MYYTTYGRVCGSPHQPAKNTTNGVNAQTRVKKLHEVVTTIIGTTGSVMITHDREMGCAYIHIIHIYDSLNNVITLILLIRTNPAVSIGGGRTSFNVTLSPGLVQVITCFGFPPRITTDGLPGS